MSHLKTSEAVLAAERKASNLIADAISQELYGALVGQCGVNPYDSDKKRTLRAFEDLVETICAEAYRL